MRPEKTDHQHAVGILHDGDQPVIVGLDIEHHPAALENARFWVRLLHVLRRFPLSRLHDSPPSVVLRLSGFDSTVTGPSGEITLHDIGANHDHGGQSYPQVPKNGSFGSILWKFGRLAHLWAAHGR